jgi:hypothetical protein
MHWSVERETLKEHTAAGRLHLERAREKHRANQQRLKAATAACQARRETLKDHPERAALLEERAALAKRFSAINKRLAELRQGPDGRDAVQAEYGAAMGVTRASGDHLMVVRGRLADMTTQLNWLYEHQCNLEEPLLNWEGTGIGSTDSQEVCSQEGRIGSTETSGGGAPRDAKVADYVRQSAGATVAALEATNGLPPPAVHAVQADLSPDQAQAWLDRARRPAAPAEQALPGVRPPSPQP